MVRDNERPPQPDVIVVDAMGKIFADGIHVGWVKKDAGLAELLGLCEHLRCNLPSLNAMLTMEAVK